MATSYFNSWEVHMVSATVAHLVNQGAYRPEDIVVLTPYLGQLRKLRQELSRSLAVVISDRDADQLEAEGAEDLSTTRGQQLERTLLSKAVRIAIVDNFQGEEALVAIVSLVRCNDQLKCGFLRTQNRINVLLSRGKHGMYIIGNSQTARTVPMWAEVISLLAQEGSFDESLPLKCPRHPNTPVEVRLPDDFNRLSPEGGCDLKCDRRLNCGHACNQKCHSDTLHKVAKCLEACQRPISGCDKHACPRLCGETCPDRCQVLVKDVSLPWGHNQTLPCWETKDLNTALCHQQLEWTLDTRSHRFATECHRTRNPESISCTTRCGKTLTCGHACTCSCCACRVVEGQKIVEEDHGTCQEPCGRPYQLCRHSCTAQCHDGPCPPCKESCEVRCFHSACKKLCSEPCTPCAEKRCTSCCCHQRCDMPCAVPCNWIPCSRRCEKELSCGHQCPSVRGETCPDEQFCQLCCSDDLKEMVVDYIAFEKYQDVDLEEDPCIIAQCGHIVTLSNMDSHFEMHKHYEIGEDGKITDVIQASPPFSSAENMKACPTCRGSLREVSRYGRLVRRAMLDESSKRHILWAQGRFLELAKKLLPIQDSLENHHHSQYFRCATEPLIIRGSRDAQHAEIKKLFRFSSSNKNALDIRREIRTYLQKVRKEEQPHKLVFNMVQNVRRRKQIEPKNLPDDIGTVQMRHFLLGTMLSLRFDLALTSAAISLWQTSRRSRLHTEDPRSEFVVDLS